MHTRLHSVMQYNSPCGLGDGSPPVGSKYSSGRGTSRNWSSLQILFTDLDCRNEQNLKIMQNSHPIWFLTSTFYGGTKWHLGWGFSHLAHAWGSHCCYTLCAGLRLVWFTSRLRSTLERCTAMLTSTRSCPEQQKSRPTSYASSWWTGSWRVVDGPGFWDWSVPPHPVSSVFQWSCPVSVCCWCCLLDEFVVFDKTTLQIQWQPVR